MRRECPGSARGSRIACQGRHAEPSRDIPRTDSAGTKEHGPPAREIHDRGFDADLARASVQDQLDFSRKIASPMLRSRRTDPAKTVGRRGSYAPGKFPEELKSNRMPGGAQTARMRTPRALRTRGR